MLRLSPGEIRFIEEGISSDVRLDGRARLDYRPFTIETGVIEQTNGSARLILETTDILVGIKVELGEPDPERPDVGKILVSVQCCPSASPEFEGRGGADLNVELATVVQRMLSAPSVIDLKKLCLLEGQQCWIIYVDALVLDSGGNLFDALSIATRAALFNTRIPHVSIVKGDEVGEFELELDPDNTFTIPVDDVPICVTLSKLGPHYILDTSLEEELCSACRVTFAVNKAGKLCGMQKGTGTVSPAPLSQMITTVQSIGVVILEKMDKLLQDEKKGKKKVGFFV